MKFTAETASGNLIRSWSPGEIRIDDQILQTNVIVSATHLINDWKPAPISQLSIADFSAALALQPEIILFGTGKHQQFPDIHLMTEIMRKGIAFEAMDSSAAARTYNVLVGEMRRVVAALLV